MKKIFGLFRLIRFELPFSAGVCVVMGQLLALNEFATLYGILLGFFSVFFISASILVSNDYFDVETDRINSPDRPIPSNLVTQSEALLFSIFLVLLGLTLSYLINLTTFIFAIILIAIGLLYNRKFKKYGIFGNLLVSFSVGMTFIYGGLSVGLPYEIAVLFFGVIAALIDLGEEIAADAMDIKGDLLIDSNSIAIKYGRTTALTISSMIFSFVIILTIVPFVLNWFTLEYIIPIAIMDFAIGYSTIRLLKSKNEEGRKYIRWIYLGATAGLIVFIIFRVIGL
ncbi:MAG: UbiA family prenyltransferase [Melioribacteraceae bacterium]|nr:MAG: UbiA family prenyltransferase [Melioribacteraceae bacterium]